LPVFSHEEDDIESFRFITSQLVVSGNVKQIQISKAFGIPYVNVKRSVKILKENGPKGFYKTRKGKSAHVLTSDKIKKAQRLLYKGSNASEVEQKINVKASTIRKAIQQGRLFRKGIEKEDEKAPGVLVAKTKSDRAILDSKASMGIASTRENDRVLAALGELTEAIPEFKSNIDVKSAGVLLSLPALLMNGLLDHSDQIFSLPKGYYGMQSIFIILAFSALLRIQSIGLCTEEIRIKG
jgi:transposase